MRNNMSLIDKIRECIEKHEYYGAGRPNVIEMNCYTFKKLKDEAKMSNYYSVDNLFSVFGLDIRLKESIPNNGILVKKEENMRIGQHTFTPIGDHSIDAMAYAMNDIRTTTSCLKHINNKLPKKYVINNGAVILFWEDGTKTIVKRAEDDSFDPVKGFLWAYFQKQSGLSKTKANKYLREIDNQNTITINIDTPLSAISHALDNIFNIKKD